VHNTTHNSYRNTKPVFSHEQDSNTDLSIYTFFIFKQGEFLLQKHDRHLEASS
jgi:hypothetical protein